VAHLVASMRLQLEQLRQHKRLTEQLEKRLLVRPLVKITYSLVEKIKAALARPEHTVVGRDVQVDGSTEMTVVAVVHHLSTSRHLALFKYCQNSMQANEQFYNILVYSLIYLGFSSATYFA